MTSNQIVVISGGTATNYILDAFPQPVSFVLPVSDNGGSSSEVIRVLGGCAVGDLRSRLVRLIPTDTAEGRGLRELLGHRLPSSKSLSIPTPAELEWHHILSGHHPLWVPIPASVRELLRAFMLHADTEIQKRSRLRFKFESASVGNLFLAGARTFFGDIDSAVEFVLRVARVASDTDVMGCLNTLFTYHIAAEGVNGEIITGQSQISHPVPVSTEAEPARRQSEGNVDSDIPTGLSSLTLRPNLSVEDLVSPIDDTIHPSLRLSQLHFNKDCIPPLESPIARVYYISPYGEEIHPKASDKTLEALNYSDVVIYSVGSLWTSLVPVLILRGVAEVILNRSSIKSSLKHQGQNSGPKRKILLLNNAYDRETNGLSVIDFLRVIRGSLEYSLMGDRRSVYAKGYSLRLKDVVDEVVYLDSGEIQISDNEKELLALKGIKLTSIAGTEFDVEKLTGIFN
ncbi:hypothetical protein DAMA08_038170 [Martiniozyma asiatica (nom. inval.)]|nr:hypothetical protein DAMA08_038170 [Martiniozyma asiatica]